MAEFYEELDRREAQARRERLARFCAERPASLHDYQGCAADEVRQLREEIAEIKKDVAAFARRTDQPSHPEHAVYQRILSRLESILADKTAGMKEGA